MTRIVTPDDFLRVERENEKLRNENARLSAEIASMNARANATKRTGKADQPDSGDEDTDKSGS